MKQLNTELVSAILAARKDLYRSNPGGFSPASGSLPPATPPIPPESVASPPRPPVETSVATPAQAAIIEMFAQFGWDRADAVGIFLTGCVRQFEMLAVQPPDVHDYLLWEQRVLGSLYGAVREPVLSPSRIKELAIRFAVDPRRPLQGHLLQYVVDFNDGGIAIGKYPENMPYSQLQPPAARKVVHTLFAKILLKHVFAQEINARELIDFVEGIFIGVPPAGLTLDNVQHDRLTYSHEGGRIRMWVMGQEVMRIHGAYEQLLLRIMCQDPTICSTASGLKNREPRLKNPWSAVRKVRDAMRAIAEEAGDFILTKPLRWADGVVPMRAHSRGSGGAY